VRYVKFLLSGSRYKEIRAKENGIYPGRSERSKADTFYLVGIGGKSHKIHQDYAEMVKPGNPVKKGDLLAKGLLKQGDHIIVNRISTNFRKPRRGEIVVFSTKGLPHVRVNSAYIKRLTGMPGEKITICNGKLYADGQLVEAPDVFVRQYTSRGYDGYLNAGLMPTCQESLVLGEDEFLFMGDNTSRSLDGRFFGGAPGKNIIGTAFFVPWPFVNRGIYGESAGSVK
jgi:signal peptidase I